MSGFSHLEFRVNGGTAPPTADPGVWVQRELGLADSGGRRGLSDVTVLGPSPSWHVTRVSAQLDRVSGSGCPGDPGIRHSYSSQREQWHLKHAVAFSVNCATLYSHPPKGNVSQVDFKDQTQDNVYR